MKIRLLKIFPLILSCLWISCNQAPQSEHTGNHVSSMNPKLATGFRITENGSYRVLEMVSGDSMAVTERFYLINRDINLETSVPENGKIIRVPIKSMVCLSATQIAFADALGLMDRIVGVASADYVVSAQFSDLIKEGKIREIGISDRFKLEQLIQLSPETVMVTMQQGQNYETLRNAGLTVIPLAEHLENEPLGRAEWIKCFGVLFGKEREAAHIFDSIATEYNRLKELTKDVVYRPTVLSGKQYGGFWSLPGGKSYLSKMIADAGATYIWEYNEESGSLMLDFETVYDRGIDADYWRFLVYSKEKFTTQNLLDEDARYAGLKAFKERKMLYCNTFSTPYFQKSPLEPQVLLADYISVFHPELLPEYHRRYYSILE